MPSGRTAHERPRAVGSRGAVIFRAMRLLEALRRLPVEIGYRCGPRWMSWLRKQWVLFRHPDATVHFGRDTYLGPGFSLYIPFNGTFVAGDRCEFRRDFRCEVHGDGRVVIGDDCHFTYSVLIQCSTTIEIGDRCMFGQSAILVDGQHRFRDLTKPMLEQGYDFHPLRIADDVTTTTKNTIMADIGERAFVGANAVVTKPIPAYTVAVGAPARPIEYFGPPGQEPAESGTADGRR
jgi:acetyltransferase-like isoleucine patch superfamily enzyme